MTPDVAPTAGTLPLLIAASFAAAQLALLAVLVHGYSKVPALSAQGGASASLPGISIVVAARDEALHIESATRALLRLDYPDYEIIVVNDRSADRTGEILGSVAASDRRLQVVTVTDLPPGWLGKNHALQLGASRATRELLLFADGDVILSPQALRRAAVLLQQERADHLTVAPELLLPSAMLALVINYIFMYGVIALRPWKASDPRSSASAGIGAFNLVRASAYKAIDRHERIRLRPDDDLMLGKVLKRAGFRQIVATGMGEVRIEWYRTLAEAARGFRKNAFAAVDYRVSLAAGAVVANLLAAWPFLAVWMTDGVTRTLYAVAAAAAMAALVWHGQRQRLKPWLAAFYPIAALLAAWIIAAAVGRTLRLGGIEWRGTFYPLSELRKNRV